MKKCVIILTILFFVVFWGESSYAQTSPKIVWQKCYGGTSYDDNGSNASASQSGAKILQLHNGGLIVAGTTRSNNGTVSGKHGCTDIWVQSLSANGSILWQKCFGGSQDETFGSIIATSDGGYAIAGSTGSNDGD